ncbi:MAG: hypothetical protein Kow0027_29830 [Saprospiraceae bacterium]
MVRIYFTFMLIAAAFTAFSQQNTRTAVQTGNWTTNATWDCNCQPKAGDIIVIPSGIVVTADVAISLTGGANPTIININGGTLSLTKSGNTPNVLTLDTDDIINYNSGDIDVPNSNGDVYIKIGSNPLGEYDTAELGNNGPGTIKPPAQLTSAGAAPLPVELTRFVASEMNESIVLEWATASELNNAGFEVQRSADGSLWEKIGWVDGHGTSLDFNVYVFEDFKPLKGVNYYRLQQVDYDGSMEYSPIVVVDMELSVQEPVIFPNPMGESAQVQLPEEWAGSLVSIFDAQGRLLQQVKADGSLMNLSGITSGVYIVKIQSGTLVSTQRLVVR